MLDNICKCFNKYDKYKLDYRKFDVLVLIIILILCLGFTNKTFQNDTFYSIPIGRDILKYGVDMVDHYSIHNIAYTYPHWLFDVLVYLVYSLSGFKALYYCSIIIYFIIGIMLYFLTVNLFKNRFISCLFTISAIICLCFFITTRAQIISYILFILELFFIEKFLATSNKKYLFAFPIISVLIVNMHCAVWIFFYILFLPYLFEYLFCLFKFDRLNLFKRFFSFKFNRDVKYLMIIMFLCIFTGFLTLNGLTPFTYLIKTINGGSISWIDEHKAPSLFHSPSLLYYLYIYIFMFLFIKHKFKLSDFVLSIGLFILAFFSFRHIALLIICSIFPLVRFFSDYLKIKHKNISNLVMKFCLKKFVFIVIIFIIISFIFYRFTGIYKQEFIDQKQYPFLAADYILDNLDIENIRLYNEYDYGSYLLFRGIPVFIDSRADLYTPQFSGLDRDITLDFLDVAMNYEEIFDYYDITHVIVYKCSSKKNCNGLYSELLMDNNLDVIYEDNYFSIFKRSNDV